MIIAAIILIIVYIIFNILTDWYYLGATTAPCIFALCIITILSVYTHVVATDGDPYYTYDYKIIDGVMVKTTKACFPAKYDVDFCSVVGVESIPLDQIRFNHRNTK